MNEQPLRVYFERIVPERFRWKAAEAATLDSPRNAPPFEVASVNSKLHRPGLTLRATFLDGFRRTQQTTEGYAYQWSQATNLTFQFVEHPAAEIPISFQQEVSWSGLGTDDLAANGFPRSEPTMTYGWLTCNSTEGDSLKVVLHEFGQAVSLIYVHQRPTGGHPMELQAHHPGPVGVAYLLGTGDNAAQHLRWLPGGSALVYQVRPEGDHAIRLSMALDAHDLGCGENTELPESDKNSVQTCYPE